MLREEEDTEEKKKIEEQEKRGKGVSEDKESEFGILVKNLVEEEYQIRA